MTRKKRLHSLLFCPQHIFFNNPVYPCVCNFNAYVMLTVLAFTVLSHWHISEKSNKPEAVSCLLYSKLWSCLAGSCLHKLAVANMIDVLDCDWHEGSSNHLPPTTPLHSFLLFMGSLPDGYVRNLETYHLACVKCLCTSKVILNLPPSLDLWHDNIPAIKKKNTSCKIK